jgi:glycosyltransferase involved in cell wall biosynthesis
MNLSQKFSVACPIRSVCDHHAKVFQSLGRLEGSYLGTRNGAAGIAPELQKLNPWVGAISYAAARMIPSMGEWAKVQCFPMFDRWVSNQIPKGSGILSSYGYAVEAFRNVRSNGGVTLLDAGNSHFKNYWTIVSEEHQRWGESVLPFPRKWYERGLQSIELTDWVFSPSSYVKKSYLAQGFPEERILHLPYPVNLRQFSPQGDTAPQKGPIRVICTGGVSLRKGFPYLLEAVRILGKNHEVELLLTEGVHGSMTKIMAGYHDLKIHWAPRLGHDQLGARLKSAHVFVLLSIEEGLARTALEAMACGLQVVLTPNTGASDFVKDGINGDIVPFADPEATAAAILAAYHRRKSQGLFVDSALHQALAFETFEQTLQQHLETIDRMGCRG